MQINSLYSWSSLKISGMKQKRIPIGSSHPRRTGLEYNDEWQDGKTEWETVKRVQSGNEEN